MDSCSDSREINTNFRTIETRSDFSYVSFGSRPEKQKDE
jgi:hypothetical protein